MHEEERKAVDILAVFKLKRLQRVMRFVLFQYLDLRLSQTDAGERESWEAHNLQDSKISSH